MQQFADNDKKIYGPYFNGVGQVYGDPIRIHRKLIHALQGEQVQVLKDLRSDNEQVRFDAVEKMLQASAYAFELMPFDSTTGQGMLEDAVLDTAKQFLKWITQKKTSTQTPPTCAPTTPATCPASAS